MTLFTLQAAFEPQGDQPAAIDALVEGIEAGRPHHVLLGVTGSGKTFTMAKVIEKHVQRPALVIAHNKTLAAQLFQEFKEFFPHNAVEYFVSYYDYYQPEAYIPSTDTYIEKETLINEEIDRLRHSATRALFDAPRRADRRLGIVHLRPRVARGVLRHARAARGRRAPAGARSSYIVWSRCTMCAPPASWSRGKFRVRGNDIEIFPAYEAGSDYG